MSVINKVLNFTFKAVGEKKLEKVFDRIEKFQKQALKNAEKSKKQDTADGESKEGLGEKYAKFAAKIAKVAVALKVGWAMMKGWAQQSPFFALQMNRVSGATNALQGIIGNALAPALEIVADFVWGLYDAYTNLSPEMKEALNVGILVVGVVTGLAAAFALLNLNMLIVIAAVAIIAAIWYLFGDQIMAIIDFLIDIFMPIFQGIADFLAYVFSDPFTFIGDLFTGFYDLVAGVLGGLFDFIVSIFTNILDFIVGTVQGLIDNVANIFSGFVDVITGIFDLIFAFFTGDFGKVGAAISQIIDGVGQMVGGLVNQFLIDPINNFIGLIEGLIRMIGNVEFLGIKPLTFILGIADVIGGLKLPRFAEGGFVGGKPIPIIAHEGEIILNAAQQKHVADNITNAPNNSRTQNIYNINLNTQARSGRFLSNDLQRALMQQGL